MIRYKSMQELQNHVDQRDRMITADQFDHKSVCQIEHADGSKFLISNPLMEQVRFTNTKGTIDEVVHIVYSEHHHPMYYMESDLIAVPTLLKK